MAPLPAPGNDGSSGNAMTDANAKIAADIAAFNAAEQQTTVNAINQQKQASASDCLWPPSAKISVPIIKAGPVHYTQSFQVPCLISYGEARAVVGAFLLVAGLAIIGFGIAIIAVVEAGPTAAEVGGVGASLAGAPEVGVPVAAAGAEVKHKQKQAAAKPPAKQQMATAS